MKQSNLSRKSNSFMVVIKDSQNGTWQGTVEWIDKNKKECFRSLLEMIKLIDSALEDKK